MTKQHPFETGMQVGNFSQASARLVAFAINEPQDVSLNEILFRPTAQAL